MNQPPDAPSSPFAARTRAPFPAAAPAAPVSAPSRRLVAPVLGALVLLLAGAFVWFRFVRAPQVPVSAELSVPAPAAAQAPAAVPAAPPPAAPRDAEADYAVVAARAAALDLTPGERAVLAAATLRASDGAAAGALAELGPLVSRRVDDLYAEAARRFGDIKLEDHAAPAVQALRLALARADRAAADGVWAEAVALRDRALTLLPAARAEIAAHLARVAGEAAGRGDRQLATYFYERVLRLEPGVAEARAHLFAYKFSPGERLSGPAGLELAYVPPGEFLRGSPAGEPGRGPDEEPARVRLTAGFFLGVTEVTQRQWDQVFGAGAAARLLVAARASAESIKPELPMHAVSWADANRFCEQLSARDGRRYRLPTEAEWEHACRAGTVTPFGLGYGLSARDANIDDGSADARLALVAAGASGRANAWGLRDMHGNVWEWCADWSAPYPPGEPTDPRGPSDADAGRPDLAMRVVRGGGWNASASDARSANRWEYAPAVGTNYIGFRVAMEPELVSP